MKKKWMLVGLDGSGKSNIVELIEKKEIDKRRKLDVLYRENSIEIPGSYLEVNRLNNAIIMIAQNQAKATLFIMEANKDSIYPPEFSKSFTRKTAVVITKSDLLNAEMKEKIHEEASKIGSEDIFFISFRTGEGIEDLKKYIDKIDGGASEIYN